jgi:hypothetical protein
VPHGEVFGQLSPANAYLLGIKTKTDPALARYVQDGSS